MAVGCGEAGDVRHERPRRRSVRHLTTASPDTLVPRHTAVAATGNRAFATTATDPAAVAVGVGAARVERAGRTAANATTDDAVIRQRPSATADAAATVVLPA